MHEIDEHESEVTAVHAAGEELISVSSHLPQLIQTTETQLSSLSDSFKSLQTTAVQIKVCFSVYILWSFLYLLISYSTLLYMCLVEFLPS